jgi:hypothetical protein
MASDPQFVRVPRSPSIRVSGDSNITANATNDRITLAAHGFAAGDEVRLVSGTAPTGLVLNTTYFVLNPTANDFLLSATLGGSAIDLTTAGSALALRSLNTRLDGLGNMPTLLASLAQLGAAGVRIDLIRVQAVGITTAGMLRLFKHDGTSSRLIHELAVTAATPSATVRAFSADVSFSGGLLLEPGHSLRAASHQAEAFDITIIQGGEF